MASKLEDLNITRDEFSRITEALKKEEFRKMFIDYCQEMNDPENRKLYEAELTQLELERGVDVKFINPIGGFVIKTSVDGALKCFINVAKCDKIDKPTSECVLNNSGQKGLSWKLPYSQAQPRKDVDRAGKPAMVYDVVFHPDTLYMSDKNSRFKKLVVDTACDAVSQSFGVVIDKTNLKFPKMLFKGTPQPTLIRKTNGNAPVDGPSPLDKIYPVVNVENGAEVRQGNNKVTDLQPPAEYTVPKYQVTHRRDVEYHELTDEMDAKLNVLTPKELVISIDLPLLSSTKDVNLDVMSNKLVLVSEVPAKYKLELNLPCTVLERDGSAKFDKDMRKLVITLPVLQQRKNMAELMREDSGVECGGDSTWNESSVDSVSSEEDDEAFELMETEKKVSSRFLLSFTWTCARKIQFFLLKFWTNYDCLWI
jgi:dynein assembly factor 2, axonemal